MTNTGTALYEFFSGFGLPAYQADSVPDNATLPYITYQPIEADWRENASVSASVWYQSTGYKELYAKVDEIKKKVGEGLRIPVKSGGCVWINRDTPFSQSQATQESDVKAEYLLFIVQALCE